MVFNNYAPVQLHKWVRKIISLIILIICSFKKYIQKVLGWFGQHLSNQTINEKSKPEESKQNNGQIASNFSPKRKIEIGLDKPKSF